MGLEDVSKIIIGTWQATGWKDSNPKVFSEIISKALELGINSFDTAEAYGKGESERMLGAALKQASAKREDIFIATKFSRTSTTKEKIEAALDASLMRLDIDYIDLFQYHWPSKDKVMDRVLEALLELRESGKILKSNKKF